MAKTASLIRVLDRDALLIDYTASGAVVLGDFVYLSGGRTVARADKDAVGTANKILGCVVSGAGSWEAQTTFASGDVVTVCVIGRVGGFSGLSAGAYQYIDDDGELTETAPTTSGDVVQIVALANNTDEIIVLPNGLNVAAANS